MKSLHYPLTVVVSLSQYCGPVSVACDTTVGIKCCPRRLVIIGKVFSLFLFALLQETSLESYECNGVVYRVGDFVYVEQR